MDELMEPDRTVTDPSSWIDQHGDILYRYTLSRLRDGEAAEEVVQETFVAALHHLAQYAGKGAERAWLLGILKRKIVDYVRQRSRASRLAEVEDEDDPSAALFDRTGKWRTAAKRGGVRPLDSLERQEFWEVLRKCLDGLPTRQADVFALREMEQLTSEDICKELGISASNLWVLLYRARLRLSDCMKSRWQTEAA